MSMKRAVLLICLLACILVPAGFVFGQDSEKNNHKSLSLETKSYSSGFSISSAKPADLVERILAYSPVLDLKPDDSSYVPVTFQPERKLGRAYLQIGSIIGYQQARYWIRADFIEDWQYRLNWRDQKVRIFGFGAWWFDSNAFQTNWTHAFAGSAYYNFARTNNLSAPKSFLLTLGESLYWEYIVEWREVISINDMAFTPFGGMAVGETLYQFGSYFNSRKGLLNSILGFINPIIKFNHWLDRRTPASQTLAPTPGWHEFRLFAGRRDSYFADGADSPALFSGGLRAEIITAPEYGRPGQESRSYLDTLSSELDFDFAVGLRGMEDFNLFMRAVVLGYYNQNIGLQNEGYGYYVGLGSAFSLFKKRAVAFYDGIKVGVRKGEDLHLEEPRQFTDKFSIVHIAGPVFDFASFSRGLKWRLVLEAYPDFGFINSLALNRYSATHDISGAKTTILYYGYYFAFGTTLASSLKIDSGPFDIDASLRYQTHGSIEGRDRFQGDLTDDFHLTDSRLGYILKLGYRIGNTPVQLEASFEGIDRQGTVRDVTAREIENRLFFGLNFIF